jgi:hypothetical protein
MLELTEIAQIYRSGAETPFLVVDWPRGFTVAARAETEGGALEG